MGFGTALAVVPIGGIPGKWLSGKPGVRKSEVVVHLIKEEPKVSP